MSYCTKQNLIDRYGETELIQLTDRSALGAIDDTVIDRAIADADGEIDGYLAGRYSAPISPIPKSLVRIACHLTRYYLYDDQAPEQITKRYDDAVKFLRGVASGQISIGVDAAGAKPTSQNTATIESGGNVFNRNDNSFI
jgi:phage gp36-like protein